MLHRVAQRENMMDRQDNIEPFAGSINPGHVLLCDLCV